jgi:multimeric flavodoxin WrbA
MKKMVAFVGSPRKNANISTIVAEIVRGAKEAGAETKVYTLSDMNIKPCQGCFHCREVETCAIKDDMQLVYEDIKEADAIVIGSPVYRDGP